jgi:hypothetical protein
MLPKRAIMCRWRLFGLVGSVADALPTTRCR